MIEIPSPTPAEIETVLVGMMDGTGAFARWVKLDDGEEETRVAITLWWADAIDPDGVAGGHCGGGATAAEAAAAAWAQACLGAWWLDPTQSADEYLAGPPLFRDSLSEEEYLHFPRRVSDGWSFELYAVPAPFLGAEKIQ